MEKNQAKGLSLRILLAEDNEINQKVAQAMLKSLGYQCDVASNGLEALEALRRQPYDVVLMDMQMPKMDGLEATRQICLHWLDEQRPRIIAMTANAMASDRKSCLDAGMDDYISKPVKVADLRGALERCIRTESPEAGDTASLPETGFHLPSFLQELQGVDEPDIFVELLGLFISDTPAHLERLREAIRQADFKEMEMAGHTLKGSCAYMELERMVSLSAELERMGREGSIEKADVLLAQLEEEFSRVSQWMLLTMADKNQKSVDGRTDDVTQLN